MDWQATLYHQQYEIFGTSAIFRVDAWGEDISATVIDKTSGVPVTLGDDTETQTIRPAATVRTKELTDAGITQLEINSGTIDMNNKTWHIQSSVLRPTPNGELDGELWFFLIDDGDGC